MDDLSATLAKTGLSGNATVDIDAIGEMIKAMQSQNLTNVTVAELMEHLAAVKVKQSSSPAPTRTAAPETPAPIASPDFSFKSPDNVFTPFKMKDTTNGKSKKDVNSSFHFGSDSDSETDSVRKGPFSSAHPSVSKPSAAESSLFANAGLNSLSSSTSVPENNIQFHIGGFGKRPSSRSHSAKMKDHSGKAFSSAPSQPAAGVSHGGGGGSMFWGGPNVAADSRPTSAASSAVPSAKTSGLFATTTANIIGSTAYSSSNIGGPGPSNQEPHTSSLQPPSFTFTIGSDGTTTKGRGSAKHSSSFTSGTSTSTKATGPFSSTSAPSAPGAQDPSNVSYNTKAPLPSSSAPQFSMGSADLLSSSKPQAGTAPAAPFSDLSNGSNSAAPPPPSSSGFSGDEPSFTVYTLGDNDILHSLNDYSSSEDSDATVSETDVPRPRSGKKSDPKSGSDGEDKFVFSPDVDFDLGGDEEDMDMSFGDDDDEILQESFDDHLDHSSRTMGSTSASAAFPDLKQGDMPVFSFPQPSAAAAATAASNATKAPAAAPSASKAPPSAASTAYSAVFGPASSSSGKSDAFLFNGQSMSASQSQFEKENFAQFSFSMGVPSATSSSNTNAKNAPAVDTEADAAGQQFTPEEISKRIALAFAGLSADGKNTTTNSSSSAGVSGGGNAVPPNMPAFTFPPTPSAPTSAAASATATAAPAVDPASTAVPELNTMFSGFNIGKSATPAMNSSFRRGGSAKKSSPAKKKKEPLGRSSSSVHSSGNDGEGGASRGNSNLGVDEPPTWWTQARAAAEAQKNGGYGDFTMPGALLSDSDHDSDVDFSDFSEGEDDENDADEEESFTRPSTGANIRSNASAATAKGVSSKSASVKSPSPKKSATATAQPPYSRPSTASSGIKSPPYSRPTTANTGIPGIPGVPGSRPKTADFRPGPPSGPPPPPPPTAAAAAAAAKTNKTTYTSTHGVDQGETHSDANMANLAELYSKQGKDLYSTGSYARALDAYNKCLSHAPVAWSERATALGNRAAVLVMLHRLVEAVNDCEEALKLDPKLVKLQVRRGRALLRLGHFGPAEKAFKVVINTAVNDLLTPREALDRELLANTTDALEGNKSNANLGLRDIAKLSESIKQLVLLEGQFRYKEALKCAEDVLKLAPYYRIAHTSKATALCETLQYDDCKTYIDEITSTTHASIQTLFAHHTAVFPCVSPTLVGWKENTEKCIQADLPATIQFLLCMGSEMALVYVNVLKNISPNRSHSADIMSKLATTLRGLNAKLTMRETQEKWDWVQKENDKIQCLLGLKLAADEKFKAKNFKAALMSYSSAIKVDVSARKWNAIIFSNRAAAHMSLGMYNDAVTDCMHAIQKDPDFYKAYLRRARAYRSINKQAESVRDYKKYLSSDPAPVDYAEVHSEMQDFVAAKKAEMHNQTGSAGPAGYTKSPYGPPPGAPPGRTQTGSSSSGAGGRPGSASNPHAGSSHSTNGAHGWGTKGPFPQGGGWSSGGGPGLGGHRDEPEDFYDKFHQYKNMGKGPTPTPTPGSQQGYSPFNRFNAYTSGTTGSGSGSGSGSGNPYSRSHFQPGGASNGNGTAGGTRPSSGPSSGAGGRRSYTSSGSNSYYHSYVESDDDDSEPEPYRPPSKGAAAACHYTTMGLTMQATEKDIKTAYRKLALQFHPDRNKDPGAEDKFKVIGEAYTILSDKTTRRQYDLTRPVSGRRK